jgi:magnesium-transporting ATPase (P-type)
MITGDKMETAECISRSCGLQQINEDNVKIEGIDNAAEWKKEWEKVKRNPTKVLIIDGKTLQFVLEREVPEL